MHSGQGHCRNDAVSLSASDLEVLDVRLSVGGGYFDPLVKVVSASFIYCSITMFFL